MFRTAATSSVMAKPTHDRQYFQNNGNNLNSSEKRNKEIKPLHQRHSKAPITQNINCSVATQRSHDTGKYNVFKLPFQRNMEHIEDTSTFLKGYPKCYDGSRQGSQESQKWYQGLTVPSRRISSISLNQQLDMFPSPPTMCHTSRLSKKHCVPSPKINTKTYFEDSYETQPPYLAKGTNPVTPNTLKPQNIVVPPNTEKLTFLTNSNDPSNSSDRILKLMDQHLHRLGFDCTAPWVQYTPKQSIFEKWKIISTLGWGTFASVLKLQNKRTKEIVAGKLLQPAKFDTVFQQRVIEMFAKEVKFSADCQCPGVVKLRKIVRGIEGWMLVQEFVDGGTLWDNFDSTHEFKSFSLFLQLVQTVMSMQSKSIVHRDLKPTNILRTADRKKLLVTDFGWSETYSHLNNHIDELPGTIEINPPEILEHSPCQTEKIDNYALALNLMLLVSHQFVCRRPAATNEEAANRVLDDIYNIRKGEPLRGFTRDSWEVFLGLSQFNPKKRYSLPEVICSKWFLEMLNIHLDKLSQKELSNLLSPNWKENCLDTCPIWHGPVRSVCLQLWHSRCPRTSQWSTLSVKENQQRSSNITTPNTTNSMIYPGQTFEGDSDSSSCTDDSSFSSDNELSIPSSPSYSSSAVIRKESRENRISNNTGTHNPLSNLYKSEEGAFETIPYACQERILNWVSEAKRINYDSIPEEVDHTGIIKLKGKKLQFVSPTNAEKNLEKNQLNESPGLDSSSCHRPSLSSNTLQPQRNKGYSEKFIMASPPSIVVTMTDLIEADRYFVIKKNQMKLPTPQPQIIRKTNFSLASGGQSEMHPPNYKATDSSTFTLSMNSNSSRLETANLPQLYRSSGNKPNYETPNVDLSYNKQFNSNAYESNSYDAQSYSTQGYDDLPDESSYHKKYIDYDNYPNNPISHDLTSETTRKSLMDETLREYNIAQTHKIVRNKAKQEFRSINPKSTHRNDLKGYAADASPDHGINYYSKPLKDKRYKTVYEDIIEQGNTTGNLLPKTYRSLKHNLVGSGHKESNTISTTGSFDSSLSGFHRKETHPYFEPISLNDSDSFTPILNKSNSILIAPEPISSRSTYTTKTNNGRNELIKPKQNDSAFFPSKVSLS